MKHDCILLLMSIIAWQYSFAQNTSKRIAFSPSSYTNAFTLNAKPVLYINSGDTVETETIDATGRDKNGVKIQKGGNPLTGPFYINNATPGNVLKITLKKISLNRNYAIHSQSFGSRALPDSISKKFKKFTNVKWRLDLQNGLASIDSSPIPYPNLPNFKIPVDPFLGCIGVAPANKKNEILSFFQGEFGGNLDFSAMRESSVLYLPVFHEGAYFYIGDGHALQGDGELAGNALETSLDVTFVVELINDPSFQIKYPRAEDSIYLMAMGMEKSIDKALKMATSGLLAWLQEKYHLSLEEATQVMGPCIEYTIAEIADPHVNVVAKIKKSILARIHN
ncbi:MAG: acetamidase [Bacteroidetes bacterium]|nr:MAG: acetamidase [Bacteroidota bacterium]